MIAIAPFWPRRKAAVVEGATGMGRGAPNGANPVVLCLPTARAAFPHASGKIAPRKCAGKPPNANYFAASPLHGQSGIARKTQSSAGERGNLPEAKLRRRDWLQLPLLGLLTLVLMAVLSEFVA